MTDAESTMALKVLFAAYPAAMARQSDIQQQETRKTYRLMLADLNFDLVQCAVARLIATAKWLPTVAEIREAAVLISAGNTRTGLEAWGDVTRAIGRQGAYRAPGKDFFFRDDIVARCVAALSWSELCASELIASERARFIESYDRMAQAMRADAQFKGLPAYEQARKLRSEATDARNAHTNQLTAGDAVANVFKQLEGAK